MRWSPCRSRSASWCTSSPACSSPFDRLSSQPTGFSSERILNLETSARRPQPLVLWQQVAEHLRAVPGVEKVALTVWPTMSGESDVGLISVNGAPTSDVNSDILHVSPGWFDTMRIPILAGSDFPRAARLQMPRSSTNPSSNNISTARAPLGNGSRCLAGRGVSARFQVVGVVRDARSRDNMRRPIRPTAYIPFALAGDGSFQPTSRGTFVVRTAERQPARARLDSAAGSSARPPRIPRRQHPNADADLSSRRPSASACCPCSPCSSPAWRCCLPASAFTACWITRCCSGGAKSASAWPSALRPRTSRGGVTADIFAMVFVGAIAGIALGMAVGAIRRGAALPGERRQPGDARAAGR